MVDRLAACKKKILAFAVISLFPLWYLWFSADYTHTVILSHSITMPSVLLSHLEEACEYC